MNCTNVNLLYFVPERLPTFRADVSVLFEKYLPRFGVKSELIGQRTIANSPEKLHFFKKVAQEIGFLKKCIVQLAYANKNDIDLIQVRDMVTVGLVAMVISRLKGIPFTYWVSFLMCEGRLENAKSAFNRKKYALSLVLYLKANIEKFIFYRVLLRNSKHVFIQSKAMSRFFSAKGISQDNFTVVPMGIDLDLVSRDKEKISVWNDRLVIGYLGTLDSQRQLDILIDALLLVKRKIPQASLIFIGDSKSVSDVDQLRSRVSELGLDDSVHFTGWLPSDQAWGFLKSSDVAVSPFPRGEILDTCSPTKLVEYLALGLPAIGNDNPDQMQVLQESDAGWLVAGDANSYADAIVSVLENIKLAQKRASRGFDYVEKNRSYDVIGKMLSRVYLNLV